MDCIGSPLVAAPAEQSGWAPGARKQGLDGATVDFLAVADVERVIAAEHHLVEGAIQTDVALFSAIYPSNQGATT